VYSVSAPRSRTDVANASIESQKRRMRSSSAGKSTAGLTFGKVAPGVVGLCVTVRPRLATCRCRDGGPAVPPGLPAYRPLHSPVSWAGRRVLPPDRGLFPQLGGDVPPRLAPVSHQHRLAVHRHQGGASSSSRDAQISGRRVAGVGIVDR